MFPSIFRGKLVRLAAPLPEDSTVFAGWTEDDDYMRLLDDDPVRPQGAYQYEHFGQPAPDSHYFHLRTVTENQLIGFVVLFNIKWASGTAEMAIGIGNPIYRGKGCGRDALRLILNYAFLELNLYRVGLSVMAYNTQAIKAYEAVGFVHEGTRRGMVMRAGQRYDVFLYGILREEWQHEG